MQYHKLKIINMARNIEFIYGEVVSRFFIGHEATLCVLTKRGPPDISCAIGSKRDTYYP